MKARKGYWHRVNATYGASFGPGLLVLSIIIWHFIGLSVTCVYTITTYLVLGSGYADLERLVLPTSGPVSAAIGAILTKSSCAL